MTTSEFDSKVSSLREGLYKFILTKCKFNENLAEDLTQIVMVKAYKFLSKNDLDSNYYKSWLYTIAKNVICDYYRRHDKDILFEDLLNYNDEYSNSAQDLFMVDENFETNLVDKILQTDIIKSGLEKLKQSNVDQYEILLKSIFYDDYDSVAQESGIPVNTVKTRVFRARKFLTNYLESKGLNLNTI